MMLDDKSLLSAYLDDELDPAGRLEVESALLSEPRLSEELHELAAVRETLAGLPRPASPRDLSIQVGAQLAGRPARWPSRGALLPAIATAAALLIALAIGWRWFGALQGRELAHPLLAQRGLTAAPEGPRQPPIVAEIAALGPSYVDDAPKSPTPEVGRVAPGDEDSEATAREVGQAHVRTLLDSPNLRRVFVVTDVLGGDASGRVDALLQQTPRGEPHYGRITISQGIVIDPKHPDQATVFALVMNDREVAQLRAKLQETFPKDVEESIAEPGVVTQLADIGQVAVLPGIAAAPDVIIPISPPSRMAFRTEAREKALERTGLTPGADLDELTPAVSVGTDDSRKRRMTARIPDDTHRPQGQSARPEESVSVVARDRPASTEIATASGGSSPSDRVQTSPDSPSAPTVGGRPAAEGRVEPSIVLVWVTTRERPGGDPPSGGPGGRTSDSRGAGG